MNSVGCKKRQYLELCCFNFDFFVLKLCIKSFIGEQCKDQLTAFQLLMPTLPMMQLSHWVASLQMKESKSKLWWNSLTGKLQISRRVTSLEDVEHVILINTNLMSFLPISALCHVQILSLSNYCDASFFSSRETSWGCLDRVGRINRITNSFHHPLANEPVSAKYLWKKEICFRILPLIYW